MEENQKDIKLLKDNPKELVIKYQKDIKHIVSQLLIYKGFYKYQERAELIQEVNLSLLESMNSIKTNYTGKCNLRTYISKVIINNCYGILRKKRSDRLIPVPELNRNDVYIDNSFDRLELQDEYDKLSAILKTYNKTYSKIELCLFILFCRPVALKFFIAYCKNLANSFYQTVLEKLPSDSEITDKKIYETIAPFLNKCDKNTNSVGAAQRWMKNKTSEIIEVLNKTHNKEVYDKYNFQTLVENYCNYKKEE